MLKRLFPNLVGALCFCVSVSTLSAGEIFSDDFSDNNRTGWWSSSTSGGIDASGGFLAVTAGRSVQTSFAPVDLSLGQSISLQFQVSFSAPAGSTSGGFRFGLFDSNGATAPSEDGNTFYLAYDGIIVATNPGATSGSPASFRYRTPNLAVSGSSALMTTTTGVYTTIGSNGATAVTFPSSTLLNVDFTALRTETGLNLSFTIKNGLTLLQSYSIAYNSPTTFHFDMLGISGSTDLGAFNIDNVSVQAVPEPSTVTLIAGGLCLAAIGALRRYRQG